MGQRPGMHHGRTAVRRPPDRGEIEEVVAVDAVKADNIVAQAFQVSRDRGTYVTAMPRDQNAHESMMGRRPAAVPTDIAGRAGDHPDPVVAAGTGPSGQRG